MRVPVKVLVNIHVGLQFYDMAALKRRITLSYKYRAREASEKKQTNFFSLFSPKKINSGVNR